MEDVWHGLVAPTQGNLYEQEWTEAIKKLKKSRLSLSNEDTDIILQIANKFLTTIRINSMITCMYSHCNSTFSIFLFSN